jgi:hypothetical protein
MSMQPSAPEPTAISSMATPCLPRQRVVQPVRAAVRVAVQLVDAFSSAARAAGSGPNGPRSRRA